MAYSVVFDVLGIFVVFCSLSQIEEKLYKNYSPKFTFSLFVLFATYVGRFLTGGVKMLVHPSNARRSQLSVLWYFGCATIYIFIPILSYHSLNYLSFPAAALLRSCKTIVILVFGVILAKKKYSVVKYVAVVLMTVGVYVFFHFKQIDPEKTGSSTLYGVVVMCVSLVFDGVANAVQEKMKNIDPPTREQRVFWQSLFCMLESFAILLFQRKTELYPAFTYCQENPSVLIYISLIILAKCVGQFFIFGVMHNLGTLVLAMVITSRKFITITISIFLFGHYISWPQWVGIFVVFFSIGLDNYVGATKKIKDGLNGGTSQKSPKGFKLV